MLDWKITGGMIIDGSGSPAIKADIGGTDDKIKQIGDLNQAEAKFVFDASNSIVCPGFIDAHSHSDAFLLIEPSSPSKIYQGITTEVTGNCGASAAPLTSLLQLPSDWVEREYPGSWHSFGEYIDLLERQKPAPNVLPLIGHARIRDKIMGRAPRAPTPEELMAMSSLLEESLNQGGRGLSVGLIYPPGIYSTAHELTTLATIVAKHDGIFTCHMRSEGRHLIAAIEEIISIGRASGTRIQISHLKTSGRANWHLVDSALEIINETREKESLMVSADRYPYTSACTELDIIFPDWASEGGRCSALSRLRDTTTRKRLHDEIIASHDSDYWESIVIGSTSHPENKQFRGKSLIEISHALDLDPVSAALTLIDMDGLQTSAFFAGMSDENMWKILGTSFVMLGTDASLRSTKGPLSEDYPHPRAFGSMPRFLRASLDSKTVALPEAVRKMTSLPAEQFKLKRRGKLAKNWFADIVVFDPELIRDTATYAAPSQLPIGIELVMINGVVTLNTKGLTGLRAGRTLK